MRVAQERIDDDSERCQVAKSSRPQYSSADFIKNDLVENRDDDAPLRVCSFTSCLSQLEEQLEDMTNCPAPGTLLCAFSKQTHHPYYPEEDDCYTEMEYCGPYMLPRQCEYCGAEDVSRCTAECPRPKVFLSKKTPPFAALPMCQPSVVSLSASSSSMKWTPPESGDAGRQ